MTRPGRDAGFTLLEIMVAIVVFGFLLLGLIQGTRFGISALAGQGAAIGRDDDLAAADGALRTLIVQMDAEPPGDPAGIVGGAHGFAFTTTLPAGAADPDARHADVAILLDRAHRLVLRYAPHLHVTRLDPHRPYRTTVLLRGVASLDFAYLDPKAGRWSHAWKGQAPPALVRLGLTFQDARHWPDIVAAPMAEQQQ